MNSYYFLAASLADVSWGHGTPRGTLDELMDYVEPQLLPGDALALKQLFFFNDMRNAVSFRGPKDKFLSPSCYDRDTILEGVEGFTDVLPVFNDFFEMVRSGNRRRPELPLIDELTILFYEELSDIESPFVREYYLRERDVRNLTIALSSETQGFSYQERLIPNGDAYSAIVAGTPPDFGLSADFPFIEELVRVFNSTDLTAHEEFMERLRWQWLDDRVGAEFFSIDFILSYVIKYQSVERWQTLSEEKGDELFGELLNTVRRSARFSLEFSDVGEK